MSAAHLDRTPGKTPGRFAFPGTARQGRCGAVQVWRCAASTTHVVYQPMAALSTTRVVEATDGG